MLTEVSALPCLTSGWFQRTKDPQIALTTIVRTDIGVISSLAVVPSEIQLRPQGSEFIHAQHMRLSRWLLIEADYGPLFSANCGSGRSLK